MSRPTTSATITVPCEPSPSSQSQAPNVSNGYEQFAVDLAITKADLKGLGEDVQNQGRKIDNLENEVRVGFQRIGSEMTRGLQGITADLNHANQPKAIAWPMVSVFMVSILALASWANSYFGQGIQAATKEAQMGSDKWQALNARMDLISQRQHDDSVNAARAEGYQDAWSKGAEKERDRLRNELDRVLDARKVSP